ncbi:MAG TPA: anti-sigma factor antagonist [Ilumatobacteraceae bacterium]|nr:anti-sigma factor antagonist [Ilumatobacteraceae bacterium]
MQVHTTLDHVGGAIVVTVDGVVDLAAVGGLHDDLARAVRRHPGVTLVVDLDAVGVLDDTGLGVLLGAAAAARDSDGDLEVVCTRPALRERLALTRFDRAVTVRDSIA